MSYNGKTPQSVSGFDPYKGRYQVYVTQAELGVWARTVTAQTQEGDQYHDAFSIFEDAEKAIAAFFDGSMGTYIDIMTGQTKSYPQIADQTDIHQMFFDDYNIRTIYYPLFPSFESYTDQNNAYWYTVLNHWANRIKRFCKFNKIRYQKLIQTMMIEYNPIADYWTNEKKIDANAPYITIANNKNSTGEYAMNPMVADWNQVAGSVDGADNPMDIHGHNAYKNKAADEVKNEHFTTTYDDASTARLESYDKQTGGTESVLPSSGSFSKREEEGNKGAVSPQDMVEKEFDIAQLWNIVELFMKDLSKEIYLQVW